MKIDLTQKEKETFKLLSQSELGSAMEEMIRRMIQHIESVRTPLNLDTNQRIALADFLEHNFINRFKVMRGEIKEVGDDNWME